MTHYVELSNGNRRKVSEYAAHILALTGRTQFLIRTDSVEIFRLLGPSAELHFARETGF